MCYTLNLFMDVRYSMHIHKVKFNEPFHDSYVS